MIKKILLILAVCLPSIAFAQGKFAVVDAETVFNAMPEREAAQKQIETASKTYEDELMKLREEMDKKYQEYQSLAADTPESIKERRIQEVQELNTRIQEFYEKAQQDLARQQEALLAPIQTKLQEAIKKVGANGGFTLVLPNTVPFYYGSDVTDVTSLVKAELGIK